MVDEVIVEEAENKQFFEKRRNVMKYLVVILALVLLPVSAFAGWQLYTSVPFYSQNDSKWNWIPLGWANDGTSIGSDGCHLCCVAMLYAKWGYSNMNPSATNSWGRWHDGFKAGTGYLIAGNIIDYPNVNRAARFINYDNIYSELAAGHPVIVEVIASGYRHFMIIFAFDGGRYWVKDPWQDWAHQDQPLYGSYVSARVYGY